MRQQRKQLCEIPAEMLLARAGTGFLGTWRRAWTLEQSPPAERGGKAIQKEQAGGSERGFFSGSASLSSPRHPVSAGQRQTLPRGPGLLAPVPVVDTGGFGPCCSWLLLRGVRLKSWSLWGARAGTGCCHFPHLSGHCCATQPPPETGVPWGCESCSWLCPPSVCAQRGGSCLSTLPCADFVPGLAASASRTPLVCSCSWLCGPPRWPCCSRPGVRCSHGV